MMRLVLLILLFCAVAIPGALAQNDTLTPRSDILSPARPNWDSPKPAPVGTPEPASELPAIPKATESAPSAVVVPEALGLPNPKRADDFDYSTLDLSEIPEIILQETYEVERSCEANYFYSSFHDCRCVAVKFMDARIKSDPNRSKDQVLNSIASECADEVRVAGFIYHGCEGFMKFNRPNDFESFCTCSANTVARAYAKNPMINLRYVENLRKNAYVECGIAMNAGQIQQSPYEQ